MKYIVLALYYVFIFLVGWLIWDHPLGGAIFGAVAIYFVMFGSGRRRFCHAGSGTG